MLSAREILVSKIDMIPAIMEVTLIKESSKHTVTNYDGYTEEKVHSIF